MERASLEVVPSPELESGPEPLLDRLKVTWRVEEARGLAVMDFLSDFGETAPVDMSQYVTLMTSLNATSNLAFVLFLHNTTNHTTVTSTIIAIVISFTIVVSTKRTQLSKLMMAAWCVGSGWPSAAGCWLLVVASCFAAVELLVAILQQSY